LADFEAFMDITGYADETQIGTLNSPAVMAEAEAVLV
jgi:hypothetical protein